MEKKQQGLHRHFVCDNCGTEASLDLDSLKHESWLVNSDEDVHAPRDWFYLLDDHDAWRYSFYGRRARAEDSCLGHFCSLSCVWERCKKAHAASSRPAFESSRAAFEAISEIADETQRRGVFVQFLRESGWRRSGAYYIEDVVVADLGDGEEFELPPSWRPSELGENSLDSEHSHADPAHLHLDRLYRKSKWDKVDNDR